jgi:mannose-6-phosphate isomerase-like protein (cupin superfamily)
LGYSIVHIDDLPSEGPGGAVRFVRRHLGVGAFGVNWFELPPNVEGREHSEEETQQEEVNIIVRGDGVYRVDGEDIPVRPGSVLRFDPETTRVPVAGSEGMTMIAIGARRGSYEPRGPF